MATRSQNTFAEGLQAILGDLVTLKMAPDADLPWIIELETAILAKLRKPIDDMMADPSTGMAGMAGFPDPNAPGASMGAGAGVGAALPPGPALSRRAAGPRGMNITAPDELRRMMSTSNVQGG